MKKTCILGVMTYDNGLEYEDSKAYIHTKNRLISAIITWWLTKILGFKEADQYQK